MLPSPPSPPRVSPGPGTRRIAALLLALVPAAACGGPPAAPEIEHVLFVLVDTLRAGHVTSYGYERDTTRRGIDHLASRGTLFTDATAQCAWTAPSIVSLFTGRYLASDRMNVPPDLTVLAEVFRQHGYDTGAFVVNPLIQNEENGFRRGFRHFSRSAKLDEIEEWLRESAGKKTYTYVHWIDPHDPYGPQDEAAWHFAHEDPALPDELLEYYDRTTDELGLGDQGEVVAEIGRNWNAYDDDVLLVDRKIARLVALLEQSGRMDRTVIVVAADHGEGLWVRRLPEVMVPEDQPRTLMTTHKSTHRGQLYQEQIHVPLVIYAPGAQPGGVVGELVDNVDIFPTLMELCDLPPPPGLAGKSLVPLLWDPSSQALRSESFSQERIASSLRTSEGYKLILPTEAGAEFDMEVELFDLRVDPWERENIADRHPEIVADLTARIERYLAGAIEKEGEEELSEENLDAMRQLGYLGDDEPQEPAQDGTREAAQDPR